jgi:hypothetical protein
MALKTPSLTLRTLRNLCVLCDLRSANKDAESAKKRRERKGLHLLVFSSVDDPSVYYCHLNVDVGIEYDNVGVFAHS